MRKLVITKEQAKAAGMSMADTAALDAALVNPIAYYLSLAGKLPKSRPSHSVREVEAQIAANEDTHRHELKALYNRNWGFGRSNLRQQIAEALAS